MVNLHHSVPYFQPLTLRSFSFPKTLSILLKTSGNKIPIFSCPFLTSIHFLLIFLWTKILIFLAGRKKYKESFFLMAHYEQCDGVAMGSPLGPTLANIFLCYWEEIWINKCPKQFPPVYYNIFNYR